MKKLLGSKYNNALELIEETGKIPMSTIDDGDLETLTNEIENLGYKCRLDSSTDYLLAKKLTTREFFKKLLGEYNYGTTFSTTTAWIKENDPCMYDYILDMMEEFAADENNQCTEEELKEFKNGEWEVEYVFREGRDKDEIEILVTAGRDGQHIANQPAWSQEYISVEDIEKCFKEAPFEKYLQMIDK